MPVRFMLQTPFERGECRQARDGEIRKWQIAQDHDPFRAVR